MQGGPTAWGAWISPQKPPCPAGWGRGYAAWPGSGQAAELRSGCSAAAINQWRRVSKGGNKGHGEMPWHLAGEGRGSRARGWRLRKASDQACEGPGPTSCKGTGAGPALRCLPLQPSPREGPVSKRCRAGQQGAHGDGGRGRARHPTSPTAPAARPGRLCGTLRWPTIDFSTRPQQALVPLL